jgi:MFS transporter, SP family, galactose:H+ symporter
MSLQVSRQNRKKKKATMALLSSPPPCNTSVVVAVEEHLTWFVIKVTAIASLGGCLFGYDMGAIGSALPQLTISFDLSNSQQEWVVSILYLGGGLGACLGGTVCDLMGRKTTILITDVIFMLGATMLYFASSINAVLMGRFVVGVGVAVSGVADVSYLHEIAPLQWRGAIVSVNEACISLGFLLAYLAGYFYHNAQDEEWRIVFAWAGVLALIQLVGMWNMPESPSWLAEQGRHEESQRAWEKIHGSGRGTPNLQKQAHPQHQDRRRSIEQMMDSNNTDAMDDTPASPSPNTCGGRVRQLWAPHYNSVNSVTRLTPAAAPPPMNSIGSLLASIQSFFASLFLRYRRQSYIALFLSICQQLCGQTSVLNYAPIIFAQATNDTEPPQWSTVAIGLVKFGVTVLVIARIHSIGRRNLLLSGMVVIAVGLLCLTVAFGGFTYTEGEADDEASWTTVDSGFQLALPGVLLVVSGYSMSFGPLTWLLTSELFPTEFRGRALGVSTIVTYLCASLVTRTFLMAQSWMGPSKVFACYLLVTVMGIVFSFMAIPDTGDKTLEQIELTLRGMPWWRFERIGVGQMEESLSCLADSTNNGSSTILDTDDDVVGGLPYERHSTPPRNMHLEPDSQNHLPELA